MSFDRRTIMRSGAALVAGSLFSLPPAAGRAAAPIRNDKPPAWYRFRLGEFELTAVSDGRFPLGDLGKAFPISPPQEVDALMRENFLAPDAATLEQNVLVVNTGKQVVVFDTGLGNSMPEYPTPNTGRLRDNLRAAGISPEQVDLVVLSHAHSDHCWGLVDASGRRAFPNAQLAMSEADFQYWTDEGNKRGPAFMPSFIEGARKNLLAYRDRLIMVKHGQELASGISAISAPGHTVGHTCYAISSAGKALVYTGDIAHHYVVLMQKPKWEFAYDTDPKQSASTRVRMLDRLSTDRTMVLSYHFPWPGIGHVAKAGEGFRWLPEQMDLTTPA